MEGEGNSGVLPHSSSCVVVADSFLLRLVVHLGPKQGQSARPCSSLPHGRRHLALQCFGIVSLLTWCLVFKAVEATARSLTANDAVQ
eukprot:2831688-Amphidinium_carterae.1